MNVEGKQLINADRSLVWEMLTNPEILRLSIPGCKSMEKQEDDRYQFEIELKVAAIVGRYSGTIEVVEPTPPSRYGLKVSGAGALGHMESTVFIDLADCEGQTEMSYSGSAEVGGKVAKVGQRVLSSVAKLVTNQFFQSFGKQIKNNITATQGDVSVG